MAPALQRTGPSERVRIHELWWVELCAALRDSDYENQLDLIEPLLKLRADRGVTDDTYGGIRTRLTRLFGDKKGPPGWHAMHSLDFLEDVCALLPVKSPVLHMPGRDAHDLCQMVLEMAVKHPDRVGELRTALELKKKSFERSS